MRIYKEDTPENTIKKIRDILYNIGLTTYETFWGNPYEGIYSVRIETTEKQGKFGTNGKGRNVEYTLASGYAEFLERIQNGLYTTTSSINRKFLNKIKQETGFYFYPDEKFITKEQFLQLPKDYLDDVFGNKSSEERKAITDLLFDRLKENGYVGILSVPFLNLKNKNVVYLPYNITLMLTGSNGMSAGNSSYEAIFQGICELFERYAASEVFYNRLTPPTIPHSYLERFVEEYKIIKQIEKKGYQVIIKDFSCGKKLPVLGLILIDKKSNKYRLNVGSETSFKIALSRILTEVFQGTKDKEQLELLLHDIPENEYDFFINDDEESMLKRSANFRKFITNASGLFPKSLFGQAESYSFDESSFISKENYNEEVKYLSNILDKDIFVRNVSFLGFPSFYTYIPQISPIGKKKISQDKENYNFHENIKADKIEDYFFDFEVLIDNEEKLLKICESMFSAKSEDFYDMKMAELLKLEFKKEYYWSDIPMSFFLTLFYYILGNYERAIFCLNKYINTCSLENDEYYQQVLLLFKSKLISDDNLYNSVDIEIRNNFENRHKLFAEIEIPKCPDCNSCTLINYCYTTDKAKYSINILNEMNKHIIEQNLL